MKPEVWGDMPAFDVTKISASDQMTLSLLDDVSGAIPLKELTMSRLPEMQAKYIDWIKELWVKEVGQ